MHTCPSRVDSATLSCSSTALLCWGSLAMTSRGTSCYTLGRGLVLHECQVQRLSCVSSGSRLTCRLGLDVMETYAAATLSVAGWRQSKRNTCQRRTGFAPELELSRTTRLVSTNLVPFHLLPRHRQLPAQALERAFAHASESAIEVLLVLPFDHGNLPHNLCSAG